MNRARYSVVLYLLSAVSIASWPSTLEAIQYQQENYSIWC